MAGLTPKQDIVEVRLREAVVESPKAAIERELAQRPEHRIVSLALASTEEFNTALVALVVIEYLDVNDAA